MYSMAKSEIRDNNSNIHNKRMLMSCNSYKITYIFLQIAQTRSAHSLAHSCIIIIIRAQVDKRRRMFVTNWSGLCRSYTAYFAFAS